MENVQISDPETPTNKKKKSIEPGIIYLSRIPTLMNVSIIRRTFERLGETSRIYLQPDVKQVIRGKRGRSYAEGWVEFKNKKIAKKVAAELNNTLIGGKRKNKWRDELWNLKYLHRFKWAHLNERLAYEKAVHGQRMRTEISQAKREANFYIQNAEKNERQKKLKKKKLKKAQKDGLEQNNNDDSKVYEVRLRDTEDEILKKRKHETDRQSDSSVKKLRKDQALTSRKGSSAGKKFFLTKIFSGGLDAEDE